MAKRKQKRMSKQELQAPDEIEAALQRFWEKISAYRKPLLIGVIALVALGAALSFISSANKSSAADRAVALKSAVAPLYGYVGEVPANRAQIPGPKPATFGDKKAKLDALASGLEGFATANEGDDSRELIDLTRAEVKLAQGDPDGALAALDTWKAAYPESTLALNAMALRGSALRKKGDIAQAITLYEQLAQAPRATNVFKAFALATVGDLHNPLIVEGGDPAKARAAYDKALALVGGPPPASDGQQFEAPGLRTDVARRLAYLPK